MELKIIQRALAGESTTVIEELAKSVKFKYLGTTNIDLYIHTNKSFAKTKIKQHLFKIKDVIYELDNKTVRDVYIDGEKIEVELNELRSKSEIGTIGLNEISIDRTNEMSGENDIVDEIFEYESSVLNKTKVTIHLYQKEFNKDWKDDINPAILKSRISLKRRALSKTLKKLLDIEYKPNNNDTKEVIKLLGLN